MRAEDAQEHFLRQVERFVVVGEQVERQLVDHALVLAHELRAGVLVAAAHRWISSRLAAADFRPGDGSNGLHGQSFRHLTTPLLGESAVLGG